MSLSTKVLSYPRQQICQPIPRKNHPSISNPPRVNNVADREHGSYGYQLYNR